MEASKRVVLNISEDLTSAPSSDLEIRCKDVTYMAHRIVLCGKIKFFDNACKLGFKEAAEGVIDLSHDDPDAVNSMLQYAYTADYTIDEAPALDLELHPKLYHALHHVDVYAIAHKYDVPNLQQHAKNYIKPSLEDSWSELWFPDVIRAIYDSTPSSDRGLRDVVVDVIVAHHSSIAEQDRESSMQVALAEIPELARDCFTGLSLRYKAASEERKDQIRKSVLYLRHRLQRGFLTRDRPPREEDLNSMSECLVALDSYAKLEDEIIKTTKIHKVLKAILKLDSIPKEADFRFKERCQKLLDQWQPALSSAMNGPLPASATTSTSL